MITGQNIDSNPDILQRVRSHISNRELDKALTVAQLYIADNVRDPNGYIALAMVYKKTRRFKDAQIILDKAIEIGPNIVTAFSLRGFCKALLNDLEGAFADCEKALKINPRDRMALELKTQMERRLQMGMISTPKDQLQKDKEKVQEAPQPKMPNPCVIPAKITIPIQDRSNNIPLITQNEQQVATQTKFLSTGLSQAIVYELEADKESILVIVPKLQAFVATLATMQALTEMYEMDGIVICADRPAKFLKTAFSKYSKKVGLIHYLELTSGKEPSGPPIEAECCCEVYDLERLIGVIDEELEHMAKKHGGEDHFVMWDDASALKFYHEPKTLLKFFETLTEHLSSMDVVHIVLLPSETASMLQRWPVSAFKATINVKSSWMSRFK
jgi:tetratricopeptide (TPR) repeat protein